MKFWHISLDKDLAAGSSYYPRKSDEVIRSIVRGKTEEKTVRLIHGYLKFSKKSDSCYCIFLMTLIGSSNNVSITVHRTDRKSVV